MAYQFRLREEPFDFSYEFYDYENGLLESDTEFANFDEEEEISRRPRVAGAVSRGRPPPRPPRPPRTIIRSWRVSAGVIDEPWTCTCPEQTCPQHGSEYIRWVQSTLNRILGLRLPVNSVLTPETRSAIRSFQEREKLPVTGIVGPDTERTLIAARSGQSPGAGATKPDEPGLTEPPEPAATPPEPGMTAPAEPAPTSSDAEFDFEWTTMDSVTGRWVRRGGMIILDDPGPSATAADRELSSGFPRPVPLFPAKPTGSAGSPSLPSVLLFPPKPADPLTADPKMDRALKNAIAKFETARKLTPGTFPVRFTLVDVTNASGSFRSAGHLETETDYIASEAKVAVMYSAYSLRDMVQRFAASTGANSANLFARLARQMDPSIVKASKNIARSLLMDVHRVPSYRNVFALTPTTWGHRVTVTFTPGFDRALERMIVPSNNADAATCVHGVGYGYLNGALAAGGFFDPSIGQGLWIAGDFQEGKKWPYVRIPSRNDGLVAQAGTTRDMAKLVSLIITDRLLDPASCAEMRGRLARAARGPDTPWVARTGIFKPGTITHNKLGLGPLKSGKKVRSEVSVYQSPVAKRRRYVVAWQNLVGLSPISFADIAKIIKAAITEFERP